MVRLLPGKPWTGATPLVPLAQLALDGRGAVTVDLTTASTRASGCPARPRDAAALRSVSSGAAALQGTLSVTGHVGVGTATPENAEGWGRALDVLGEASAKLSLRTTTGKVDARVMAHDAGIYGSAAGMPSGRGPPASAEPGHERRDPADRQRGRAASGSAPTRESEPKHDSP